MGGTYTAPVMATRTVTTCIGNNGNCCVQYDDSKKMWLPEAELGNVPDVLNWYKLAHGL